MAWTTASNNLYSSPKPSRMRRAQSFQMANNGHSIMSSQSNNQLFSNNYHYSSYVAREKEDIYHNHQVKSSNSPPYSPLESPQTEEECVERFQGRILSYQERQLLPLKEDVADWLNKTLDGDQITADNFLDMLDTGVVLCRLGRAIQAKMEDNIKTGKMSPKVVPRMGGRLWERARKGTFYARENAHNFLAFCKQLGVHPSMLFESDDIVLHAQPRNVLLCLLEVGRIASRFGIDPPGLISLESEIDRDEEQMKNEGSNTREGSPSHSWSSGQSAGDTTRVRFSDNVTAQTNLSDSERDSPIPPSVEPFANGDSCAANGDSSGAESTHSARDSGIVDDVTHSSGTVDVADAGSPSPSRKISSKLDQKVEQVLQETQSQCRCYARHSAQLRLKRISEGKYRIGDKIVFVRLLNSRHVMVRVGGGWDTLENFLYRHDPCRISASRSGSQTSLVSGYSTTCSTPRSGSRSRSRSITPDGSRSVDSVLSNRYPRPLSAYLGTPARQTTSSFGRY